MKAVVLLSGGLDSTTCLAYAKKEGFDCYAMSFAYGQRHQAELKAAERIAHYFKVKKHLIFPLDLDKFGGSALTDPALDVPSYVENNISNEIPITYVPARNTIFLALALGWAEAMGAEAIFIGASCVDYSHYPDCRPEFFNAFQMMANVATKVGVSGKTIQFCTPLLHLSKAETIRLGMKLGVDYAMTVSCYQLNEVGQACGDCDSCGLRKKGFLDAGLPDVTVYKTDK